MGAIEEFPACMLPESGEEPETAQTDRVHELDMLATMLRGLNAIGLELAHSSRNCTESNANAQSIAQASERLFVSVFEISQSTDEAAREAATADESAATGLAAVRNAITAMQKITAAVDDATKKLDDLSRASQRTDQILSLTTNLAAQTKLLALNATIEAARAGDAGRSFAVVAGEVKRLAEQSAKASEEIKSDLSALYSGMSQVVSTIAQTAKAVSEGEEAIASAGATMDAMSQQVSAAAQKMKDIAEIAGNQSGITTDIAQCVDKITVTAKEGAERLMGAAQKMKAGNAWFSEAAEQLASAGWPETAIGWFKADHLLIARRLTDVLLGTEDPQAAGVPDAAGCRLQQWLDENSGAGLEEIGALHEQVHELAQRVLRAREDAGAGAALEAFSAFSEANNRLCRCLNALGA